MGLEIHVLGRPRVAYDGVDQPPPRGHKPWALLCLLLLTPAPLSRERLAGLLFSDAADPLGSLRWNLAELRRMLGPAVAVQGDPVMLDLPADARVDVRILVGGTWVEALALPGLGRELLEGIEPVTDAPFEAWLLAERRRFAGLSAATLREAATARLAGGDARAAVDLATRLVELDGYDEEAQALLIRAHVAAGDQLHARRYLATVVQRFRDELGVEPSATLVRAAEERTWVLSHGAARGSRAAAEALIDAGEAAIGAGAIEAGLETLRRAVADARELPDPVLNARALVALGSAYIHGGRGRDGEGATALHAALQAVDGTDARELVSEACRELGYVELLRGRYDRAELWLNRALDEATHDGLRAAALGVLGSVTSDRGQTDRALARLADAAAVAEQLEKPRLTTWAYTFLGRTHLLRNELGEAREALERALSALRTAGWMTFLPWPQSLLATVDLAEGRVEAASDAFEAAFALGCQIGDPCWEGMGARGIGLVRLMRGDVDEGLRWLVDARTRSTRIPDSYLWITAFCLDTLCEAVLDHPTSDARRWIADLESLASRTGMNEMLVRAQLHAAALGVPGASDSAMVFAAGIDNPVVLSRLAVGARAAY